MTIVVHYGKPVAPALETDLLQFNAERLTIWPQSCPVRYNLGIAQAGQYAAAALQDALFVLHTIQKQQHHLYTGNLLGCRDPFKRRACTLSLTSASKAAHLPASVAICPSAYQKFGAQCCQSLLTPPLWVACKTRNLLPMQHSVSDMVTLAHDVTSQAACLTPDSQACLYPGQAPVLRRCNTEWAIPRFCRSDNDPEFDRWLIITNCDPLGLDVARLPVLTSWLTVVSQLPFCVVPPSTTQSVFGMM